MNRRRFLAVLAGAAAVAALDPERLLWTPGATTHILPPPHGWRPDLCRCGHPPGYHKGVDVAKIIRDASQQLADHIDAEALKNYAFYAGVQWPRDEAHLQDALRYAIAAKEGELDRHFRWMADAQREMNEGLSAQLEVIVRPTRERFHG